MNATFRTYFIALVSAFVVFAHAEDVTADKRLLAAWKTVQADGLGDVYYLYPDGLFIRQGVRRREFVTIGRWRIEEKKHLVLFDLEPRNTTLSAEALASIKAKKEVFVFTLESDEKMHWASATETRELKRIRDLPDRTENIYWGLGTDDDYERAIRHERGVPPKQNKKPNKAPEPTTTSVMPAAEQPSRRP